MSEISETCGGGDAGRPLVPGSLRGYRTWHPLRRRAPVPDGSLPLTSVTRRHVVWGVRLNAGCIAPDAGVPGPSGVTLPEEHAAPRAGCRCGIYGWYTPHDAGMLNASVFGVIEASGLILMGDRGFRAERARITAVVTRNRRLTRACPAAGITVYRSRRALLRDHPPEDLSSLLGDFSAPPADLVPPPRSPHRFNGTICFAVWARTAIVALAVAVLPVAGVIFTAIMAELALIVLLGRRLRA